MTEIVADTVLEEGVPDQPLGAAPAGVKHMKWWGWGLEGVAFHHEDKPGFAPFVVSAVDLDLNVVEPGEAPDFAALEVPEGRAPEALLTALRDAVGAEYVVTADLDRVVHTYGKSVRDLIRIRAGQLGRVPDAVVYPADEDEVRAVVALAVERDAVLIPFGGGSNISGSLEAPVHETRAVISLDMGRLDALLDIDEDSGLARIQAGAQGPRIEEQLTARGWTLGHFPDSFTHSTLGGWIATRSSGMQSDKFGDIADITRGLRLVRPDGVVVLRPLPSTSTGPSVREMILGSEGRLGVITEATVQVHRLPEKRVILGYLFKTFSDGLQAMKEIAESDATPSVTRVSDGGESRMSFATAKASRSPGSRIQKGLFQFLEGRGWNLDEIALSFVGYEGGPELVARNQAIVKRIIKKHHGLLVGTGPGVLYDQKKFDTPYIRDFLLDRGATADVSETAAPWSKLQGVYDAVTTAARDAFDRLGVVGWVMCHLSHSYHSGACLYFTFAFKQAGEPLAQYDTVKSAIQQAFIDAGGTLSHHHAVGVEHSPWLEQDISPEGVVLMRGLFDAADPGANFNPGKIIQAAPAAPAE